MELFKIFGTVAINSDSAKGDLDKITGHAENASSKIGSALGKVGGVVAKAGAVAVGAAATATAALVKSSISAYAEYEQLVGGVETLFGDSSDLVVKYANNAYKTSGLSANEYMETVTSFSASLLQSLGGDTQAAAEYAEMAVTDMSDNANKMGTDMASIQNAYQGFAKQNYTMLDNLKLGYGGTKSEMERLITDAEKLDSSFKAARDENGDLVMSYADVVDAIHIVQTDMGITGTTALEASTTIQGSVGSMKAAWQNFVTGLADENADLGQLINNLIDSAVTVGQNINTRLQILLPRLVEGLTQLANSLLPMLPGIVESTLPGILQGAVALVNGLIGILPQLISTIVPIISQQAPVIVTSLSTALISNLPLIIQSGIQLLLALIQGIAQSLPQLIPVAVEAAGQLIIGLLQSIPQILTAGGMMIQGLLEGLYNALINGMGSVGTWIDQTIVQPIKEKIEGFFEIGGEIVSKIWGGITGVAEKLFPSLGEKVGEATSGAVEEASAEMDSAVAEAETKAEESGKGAGAAFAKGASQLPEDAKTPVKAMAEIMDKDTSMDETGVEVINRTASNMESAVYGAGFYEAGVAAMQRLLDGINSMEQAIYAKVTAIASAAAAKVQEILNSANAAAQSAIQAAEAEAARRRQQKPSAPNQAVATSANGGSGITIVQNISTVPQTPVEFAAATAAYFEQARWSMA